MPRPEYKQLNIRAEDYQRIEEFARKLSATVGTEIKLQQAILMAITQYEVKHKLTQ